MKKSIFVALFAMVVCASAAFAQTKFAKSKKVTESEVPVAVMQAFEKDGANIEKGTWKLYYTEERSSTQARTTFTPERYEFTGKRNGEKVVLVYKPNGEAETSKGIDANK